MFTLNSISDSETDIGGINTGDSLLLYHKIDVGHVVFTSGSPINIDGGEIQSANSDLETKETVLINGVVGRTNMGKNNGDFLVLEDLDEFLVMINKSDNHIPEEDVAPQEIIGNCSDDGK